MPDKATADTATADQDTDGKASNGNATILFQLPPDTKNELQAWAVEMDRSMSSLIRILINQGLARRSQMPAII